MKTKYAWFAPRVSEVGEPRSAREDGGGQSAGPRFGPFPLSELQRVMLFDAMVAPDDGGYTLQKRFPLHERVDARALERAWQAVFDHRSALRTAFSISPDKGPEMQQVLPSVRVQLEQHDWRSISPTERERKHREFLAADRRTAFDFSAGPPSRLRLFHFSDDHSELLWTSHHAMMDGRSYVTVVLEAFQLYDAFRSGNVAELPVDRPFSDYVAWSTAQDLTEDEKFWSNALRGITSSTPVPADRPRTLSADEDSYFSHTLQLDEATTAQLVATAKEARIPVHGFLHAAWALVLHAYSDHRELLFGTTRGSRTSPTELGEPLPLGPILTTLPLGVVIDPDVSAIDVVRHVADAQRALRPFEHTPPSLIRRCSRIPANAPLFETVVVFNDATFEDALRARGGPAWANRGCIVLEQAHGPLTLNGSLSRALELRLAGMRRRVADAEVIAVLAHLVELIGILARAPSTLVRDLPRPVDVPAHEPQPARRQVRARLDAMEGRLKGSRLLAAFCAFWARVSRAEDGFVVGVTPQAGERGVSRFRVPALRAGMTLEDFVDELTEESRTPSGPPRADVYVELPEGGAECRWWVDQRGSALDSDALAELLVGFARAAARGDQDLTRIPLLVGPARERLLVEWNATGAAYPTDSTAYDLFREQVRAKPHAPAVRCGALVSTYGELDRRARTIASNLRQRGVARGDRVGIYLDRSVDLVAALLGVMAAGAAYVPLDPIYPADRIAFMLADAKATFVITDASREADLAAAGCPTFLLHHAAADELASCDQPEPTSPEDLAYVIYTSGSTGRPKGVAISHRALTNLLCAMARTPGLDERDTLLAVTTVCFDIAALELFLPLVVGAVVEVAAAGVASDPFALRLHLESTRPTVVQATPATWRMLIAVGWQGHRPLKLLCGGEALPNDLASELIARADQVWNMYGPTETTIWSTVSEVRAGETPNIGRPISNTSCFVVDARGVPAAPGTAGELYIGGAGVAKGYHMRSELTAERFVTCPELAGAGTLYRTGDLVRWRADGNLEHLGRIDNQIKLNGYRIELGEIESALRGHPSVREAVVALRADSSGGDARLVGYVVPRAPLAGAPASELLSHLRASLPEYMLPAQLVSLEKLPLTPNGKIDRGALPPPPADAPPDGAGEAIVGAEETVADIWRRTLGLGHVSVDAKFFELGGSSLDLLQVVVQLKRAFGRQITSVDMFRHPTVRTMAGFLGHRAATESSAVTKAGPDRRALGALRRRRNTAESGGE